MVWVEHFLYLNIQGLFSFLLTILLVPGQFANHGVSLPEIIPEELAAEAVGSLHFAGEEVLAVIECFPDVAASGELDGLLHPRLHELWLSHLLPSLKLSLKSMW